MRIGGRHSIFTVSSLLSSSLISMAWSSVCHAIDFGDVEAGKYSIEQITITNPDPGSMKFLGFSISGPGAAAFAIEPEPPCLPNVITTSQTCVFNIEFSPTSFADYGATGDIYIRLYNTDGEETGSIEWFRFLEGTGTHRLVETDHCSRCRGASSVNLDNLSVEETIPLVGVPFSLSYSSDTSGVGQLLNFGLSGWMPNIYKVYDKSASRSVSSDGSVSKYGALSLGSYDYTFNKDGTEAYEFGNAVSIRG